MHILKKFKRTIIWRYILLFFVKPILDLIWKNIFNLHGRILYFLWFKKKREFYKLKNDFLVIKDNKDLKELSNILYNQCLEFDLDNMKKKMLDGSIFSENQTNSGKKTYTIDLYEKLNNETKRKILDFATSEKIISSAAKHLGVFPILSRIKLNYNIVNEHENRGAMLWHRDGFGFKSFDIFISITNVNHENGPLFVSKENNSLGIFYRLQNEKNLISGEAGKIDDNSETSKKLDQNIETNIGPAGTALMIDSYSTYHKGGNCKSNYRIVLRISFQTCDALDLSSQNEEFKYLNNIHIGNTKSKYLKYFFFFRSKLFFSNYIKIKLIKFYRIMQFYQKI